MDENFCNYLKISSRVLGVNGGVVTSSIPYIYLHVCLHATVTVLHMILLMQANMSTTSLLEARSLQLEWGKTSKQYK